MRKTIIAIFLLCLILLFACGCSKDHGYPKMGESIDFYPDLKIVSPWNSNGFNCGTFYMIDNRTNVVYMGFYNTAKFSGFTVCYNADGSVMSSEDLFKLIGD